MENIQEISQRLRELRLGKGLEQTDVADFLGYKSFTTISKWENGKNLPKGGKLAKLAVLFNTTTDYILHGDKLISPSTPLSAVPPQNPTDELKEQILETVRDLSPKGKKSVLSYASDLLEQEQDEAALAEPELFKIYYTSAAKAGPKGFGYDDYESDYAYTDQEPPRYDIATMVDGQSMAPKYQDGDILYLRDYGASTYNGDECVVVVDDKSYFKKVYSTDIGLLLVSLNDDKTLYPDFEIDFPPTDGSHIKIFNVVGSFTPLER